MRIVAEYSQIAGNLTPRPLSIKWRGVTHLNCRGIPQIPWSLKGRSPFLLGKGAGGLGSPCDTVPSLFFCIAGDQSRSDFFGEGLLMTIYDTLGVRTVINVAGPVTRLSGAPLHPDVAAAMAEAAQHCVRIEDLQEAAGRELVRGDGRGGGLRDGGRGFRVGARGGGVHRGAGCRGDGSLARDDRTAQRNRHSAPAPDGVHACPPARGGETRRGRLSRLSGAGDYLAVADRSGDHRADGGARLLVW